MAQPNLSEPSISRRLSSRRLRLVIGLLRAILSTAIGKSLGRVLQHLLLACHRFFPFTIWRTRSLVMPSCRATDAIDLPFTSKRRMLLRRCNASFCNVRLNSFSMGYCRHNFKKSASGVLTPQKQEYILGGINGGKMTDRTIPSAVPAEIAERQRDDTHLYASRPRTNRLVIDMEAHERAIGLRDAKLEAWRRAIEDAIAILKGAV